MYIKYFFESCICARHHLHFWKVFSAFPQSVLHLVCDIKNGIDQARLKRNVKEIYVNTRAIAVLLKRSRVVCFGDPEFGGDSPWTLANVRHFLTPEKGFFALKMDGRTVR